MPSSTTQAFFSFAVVLACGAAGACSSSSSPGSTSDATVDVDSSSPLDGAKSACTGPSDCDDGFDCTIDSCSSGRCTHTIGPNAGATACATGSYCTLDKGCVASTACAVDADCPKGDACKFHMRCDPSSALCIWETLDRDGDGHPPQVCGGDDCDDADPTVHPGALEICDGKDNDCDGVVDDGATCGDPLRECTAGSCLCKLQNACGSLCADTATDPANCGACGHACASFEVCRAGACSCDAPAQLCGSTCTNLDVDVLHCGACGHACQATQFCSAGTCTTAPVDDAGADASDADAIADGTVTDARDAESGGVCPASCVSDSDCQASCPDPGAGNTTCCDPGSGQCYVSSSGTCGGDAGSD